MPPPRTDAAHIAPYLTHLITHHGQLTLVPPDNNGRRRKAKQSGSSRNPREEPVRFSSGEVSLGRPSRATRSSRTEEQYNDSLEDIPDYPPPSFLEAISSPPVSVCPSTTTLGRFTAPVSRQDSDSDSECSLDIVENTSPVHSQTPRGRSILDPDPDGSVCTPTSSTSRSHRRHLSLSPLRTLFPPRNPRDSGHALSAQSTPSPHSLSFSRSSPFSRSTTSLRNLISSTPAAPLPSSRESLLGSRRFFSHKDKGKERATGETLDSWEIVESELPAALTTPAPSEDVSPVIDVSLANMPPPVASTPHPLSERDRQTKIKHYFPRVRERERRVPPPPPPPPAPVPFAPGEGPPIVTVRVKKPPPPAPPKKKPQLVSSPLRGAALPELDLDRAIRTPLPLTPVTGSPTSPFALSSEPGLPSFHRPPLPALRLERLKTRWMARGNTRTTTTPAVHFLAGPGPASPWTRLSADAELNRLAPTAADLQHRNSSASSVDLEPAAPHSEFMDLTDLDLLLARLEDDHRDGGNYDDLWMISDFIGPATRTRTRADSPSTSTFQQFPTKMTPVSVLLTGVIEVQRRRTTKDGRVKLKLAVLGIAVDRCGICMTQFKKAESARLSEKCNMRFMSDALRGGW
ncbi:hypothetical protein K438DRAFT_2019609 [Mycena galopus ATCC 62051]|nr:hypothetical protein K438DRAFT_2019609 [Mycena galopus ATCC 62051]